MLSGVTREPDTEGDIEIALVAPDLDSLFDGEGQLQESAEEVAQESA